MDASKQASRIKSMAKSRVNAFLSSADPSSTMEYVSHSEQQIDSHVVPDVSCISSSDVESCSAVNSETLSPCPSRNSKLSSFLAISSSPSSDFDSLSENIIPLPVVDSAAVPLTVADDTAPTPSFRLDDVDEVAVGAVCMDIEGGSSPTEPLHTLVSSTVHQHDLASNTLYEDVPVQPASSSSSEHDSSASLSTLSVPPAPSPPSQRKSKLSSFLQTLPASSPSIDKAPSYKSKLSLFLQDQPQNSAATFLDQDAAGPQFPHDDAVYAVNIHQYVDNAPVFVSSDGCDSPLSRPLFSSLPNTPTLLSPASTTSQVSPDLLSRLSSDVDSSNFHLDSPVAVSEERRGSLAAASVGFTSSFTPYLPPSSSSSASFVSSFSPRPSLTSSTVAPISFASPPLSWPLIFHETTTKNDGPDEELIPSSGPSSDEEDSAAGCQSSSNSRHSSVVRFTETEEVSSPSQSKSRQKRANSTPNVVYSPFRFEGDDLRDAIAGIPQHAIAVHQDDSITRELLNELSRTYRKLEEREEELRVAAGFGQMLLEKNEMLLKEQQEARKLTDPDHLDSDVELTGASHRARPRTIPLVEYEELETRLTQLNHQLDQVRGSNLDLHDDVMRWEKVVESNRRELGAANSEIDRLKSELRRLQDENGHWHERAARAETAVSQLSECQRQRRSLQDELLDAQEKLYEATAELSILQEKRKQWDKLELKSWQLELEKRELLGENGRLIQLTKERDMLESAVLSLVDANNELKEQITELNRHLKMQKKNLHRMRSEGSLLLSPLQMFPPRSPSLCDELLSAKSQQSPTPSPKTPFARDSSVDLMSELNSARLAEETSRETDSPSEPPTELFSELPVESSSEPSAELPCELPPPESTSIRSRLSSSGLSPDHVSALERFYSQKHHLEQVKMEESMKTFKDRLEKLDFTNDGAELNQPVTQEELFNRAMNTAVSLSQTASSDYCDSTSAPDSLLSSRSQSMVGESQSDSASFESSSNHMAGESRITRIQQESAAEPVAAVPIISGHFTDQLEFDPPLAQSSSSITESVVSSDLRAEQLDRQPNLTTTSSVASRNITSQADSVVGSTNGSILNVSTPSKASDAPISASTAEPFLESGPNRSDNMAPKHLKPPSRIDAIASTDMSMTDGRNRLNGSGSANNRALTSLERSERSVNSMRLDNIDSGVYGEFELRIWNDTIDRLKDLRRVLNGTAVEHLGLKMKHLDWKAVLKMSNQLVDRYITDIFRATAALQKDVRESRWLTENQELVHLMTRLITLIMELFAESGALRKFSNYYVEGFLAGTVTKETIFGQSKATDFYGNIDKEEWDSTRKSLYASASIRSSSKTYNVITTLRRRASMAVTPSFEDSPKSVASSSTASYLSTPTSRQSPRVSIDSPDNSPAATPTKDGSPYARTGLGRPRRRQQIPVEISAALRIVTEEPVDENKQ